MPQLGPHSRPGKLSVVDGRRSEARFMANVRSALLGQIHENPSTMQLMLIEQCVVLSLRIHLMDLQFLKQWETTDPNQQDYLAWINALDRLHGRLGLGGPVEPDPGASLPEHYDAELVAAAHSVMEGADDRSALDIRAEAARLAYRGQA